MDWFLHDRDLLYERVKDKGTIFLLKYRRIPVINPRLILIQTQYLVGLYSGEFVTQGVYNLRDLFV